MRAYQSLVAHFDKINHLEGARAVLHWDGAAMMPSGGAEARAGQLSTLSVMIHQMTCDPKVNEWLNLAEAEVAVALSSGDAESLGWAQANLVELRRALRHASAVPDDLVGALSEAGSKCEMVWREARAANDFKTLKPHLEEVLRLTREVATVKSEALGVTPYEALLDQYEPGASESSVDAAFAQLSLSLPQLIEDALEAQARRNEAYPIPSLSGPFSVGSQRALGIKVMSLLGFDFDHGRLDVSHHPFCGGIPSDVRITTRYSEAQFTQSLMGVIHETGHALYEQGLPRDWVSQPVGKARGMSVHESQSLFWEMQVGRSRQFIHVLAPLVAESFGGDPLHPSWSVEGLRREYTKVERSLIRVDADEVTYPAHVILRYDLERQLLGGDLEIAELPEAWNDSMERLVGIRPPSDRDGCMQDIHWMDGAFGYFPTYTLGAMTAAQLFEAVKSSIPDVHEQIRAGELHNVLSWLRDHVHSQGSRWSTDELLTRATGRPLQVTPFLKHLRSRYVDEVVDGLSWAPPPFNLTEEDVELNEVGVLITQDFVDDALELTSEPPIQVEPPHSSVLPDLPPEVAAFATQVGAYDGDPSALSGDQGSSRQEVFDLDDLQEMERELDGLETPPALTSDDFEEIDFLDAAEFDELDEENSSLAIDEHEPLDSLDGFESLDGSLNFDGSSSAKTPLTSPSNKAESHSSRPQTIEEAALAFATEISFGDDAFEEASTMSLIDHLNTVAAPQVAPASVPPAGDLYEGNEQDEAIDAEAFDSLDGVFELEGELRLAAELSEALGELEDFNDQEEDPQGSSELGDRAIPSVFNEGDVLTSELEADLAPLDLDIGVDPGPSAYESSSSNALSLEGLENEVENTQSSSDNMTMIGYAKEAIELMDSYQPIPGSEPSPSAPIRDRVRSIIEKTRGAVAMRPPESSAPPAAIEASSSDEEDIDELSRELSALAQEMLSGAPSARSESEATRDDDPTLINSQQFGDPRIDEELANMRKAQAPIAEQRDQVDNSTREREDEPTPQQIFKLW